MSKTLFALDPGLTHIGIAVFEDGRLRIARTLSGTPNARGPAAWKKIRSKTQRWMTKHEISLVDRFVYERPRVRRSGRGYSDDLFELVGATSAIMTISGMPVLEKNVAGYIPRKWNGGRPKQANHYRIKEFLEDEELGAFETTSKDELVKKIEDYSVGDLEHALDAVGVGLFDLERFS